MDIISLNEAATANGRIEKFNANPDSNSGVLTQPKVIEAGETVTIKSGRQAILADTVVEGELVIEAGGEVFVPAGAGFDSYSASVKLTENQTVAGVKTFTSSPIVPTPTTDFQVATKKYVDDAISVGAGAGGGSGSSSGGFNPDNDIMLSAGKGVVMTSGNGTMYKLYIDNDGRLTTEVI